ncbi:Uncharacterised protein [Mycobacteroides abscessus subsp. abscessus]|nr:Uncharacterised protein [Mycobacteroides abscessus subsp. abscessus]
MESASIACAMTATCVTPAIGWPPSSAESSVEPTLFPSRTSATNS